MGVTTGDIILLAVGADLSRVSLDLRITCLGVKARFAAVALAGPTKLADRLGVLGDVTIKGPPGVGRLDRPPRRDKGVMGLAELEPGRSSFTGVSVLELELGARLERLVETFGLRVDEVLFGVMGMLLSIGAVPLELLSIGAVGVVGRV